MLSVSPPLIGKAAAVVYLCVYSALVAAQEGPAIPTDPPPTSMRKPLPPEIGAVSKPWAPQGRSPTLSEVDPKLVKGPLTIDQAVAVALSVNPSLAQAGESLFLEESRAHEAESALNPTLTAGPGESYIRHVATEAYGVAATLPIDISRLLAAATDQARFEEIGARLDVNRIRNEVVFRVESAFYAALRAKALERVAVENLQNSLDAEYDAEARYKARAVAYIDVLRAQTGVADAQKQVIQTRSATKSALGVLASAMGIDVMQDFDVTDTGAVTQPPGVRPPGSGAPLPPLSELPPRDESGGRKAADRSSQSLVYGPEFNAVLDEALRTRPEVLEADASIAAAEKGVTVARRSMLPQLAVGVGYFDLRTQSGSRVDEPQAYIGLSVPLYDGGLAKARVQEAQASVASAITQRREFSDHVALDVQQAYLALAQSRDQVAVANQALAQARAGFDLARVRYKAGVSAHAGISPLLELSDAQAALAVAEQNQVNALYDYNGARAQLDRAAGRFAYVANGPGFAAVPDARSVGGVK
jgi:outer membrane protein TolC